MKPLLLAAFLSLLVTSYGTTKQDPRIFDTSNGRISVITVAEGLVHPWSLAFLPDGRMLVTERHGRLRIVTKDGALSKPLAGVPKVYANGQGGLLDVVLDPAFAKNGRIYLSYAEPREGGAGTTVLRARLQNNSLVEARVIFRQTPALDSDHHFGSRLVFADDGSLFIGLGERGKKVNAQVLSTHQGKVIRIRPDGSVPKDNPFVNRANARPEIWSYGHRNIQGAALHPITRRLWTHEHGPRGGDELNIPQAGKNYGWPVVTYGIDYTGEKIGEGTSKPGIEEPIYKWVPSIAPSGMAFYTGDQFPQWKGNLFVGALVQRHLERLTLEGDRVVAEERLLLGLHERIRDVRMGPDGYLYLLTDDSKGRLLRLEPRP